MSGKKALHAVKAVIYFAASVWLAYMAEHSSAATEKAPEMLIPIYAISVALLYICFMCVRNATRITENVVTPALLLQVIQNSKAAPVDPDLALTVRRTVAARLTIMAYFLMAASLAIWIGNYFAAGHEHQYIYFAVLQLGVVAAAQIAAIRLGDV